MSTQKSKRFRNYIIVHCTDSILDSLEGISRIFQKMQYHMPPNIVRGAQFLVQRTQTGALAECRIELHRSYSLKSMKSVVSYVKISLRREYWLPIPLFAWNQSVLSSYSRKDWYQMVDCQDLEQARQIEFGVRAQQGRRTDLGY